MSQPNEGWFKGIQIIFQIRVKVESIGSLGKEMTNMKGEVHNSLKGGWGKGKEGTSPSSMNIFSNTS
jgi:hypothetical protein